MAFSEITVTATVGTTEWSFTANSSTIAARTDDGIVQGFFDMSALAAGDHFLVRVYEKVQSAGTQGVVFEAPVSHNQSQPVLVTPALTLLHGWDFTVVKVSGTNRSISGSIRVVS